MLATQFQGFGSIVVDTGANWTLAATNTIAAGIKVTANGTLSVAGTLLNQGSITGYTPGTVARGGTGINLVAGELTNDAQITGGAGYYRLGGTGVHLSAGSLVNNGTIAGGISTGPRGTPPPCSASAN